MLTVINHALYNRMYIYTVILDYCAQDKTKRLQM